MEAVPSALIAKRSITTVSFALFGTVLQRRCLGPEGLYERTVQLAPVPERIKQMADSFIQHRNLAQHRLRISEQGGGQVALVSGITIETIYHSFAVHALSLIPSSRRHDPVQHPPKKPAPRSH